MPAETTTIDPGLVRGGEVELITLEVHSSQHIEPFDFKDLWVSISLYEDLEKDYISGSVSIVDTQNILVTAPIVGNEKIVLEFKTPSHETGRRFVGHVTVVNGQTKIRQGAQGYVLQFVSPEFYRNHKMQFSKAYNKTLISDMVEDIYVNYLADLQSKPISIQTTKNRSSCVVPTLSPLRAIEWLGRSAQSPTYPTGAGYIFFENRHGYNFGSLEALVSGPTVATYRQSHITGTQSGPKDIREGFYNLATYNQTTPDVVSMIGNGVYASKSLRHDLVLRKITPQRFDYFDTFDSLQHTAQSKVSGGMGSASLHNDINLGKYDDSHTILVPDHYGMFDDDADALIPGDVSGVRNSQLSQYGAFTLDVTVPGDSNRTIGEVVDIRVPSVGRVTLDGSEGEEDPRVSGRYLVGTVIHQIERDISSGGTAELEFTTTMSLKKDSYETPLPTQTTAHWR